MTQQTKAFLISLFSVVWLISLWFIVDTDTLIFENHQPDNNEAVSNTFIGLSELGEYL